MSQTEPSPATNGRTITGQPDAVPSTPKYVADYVDQKLCDLLEHDDIHLDGLCTLGDHNGFTLTIDMGVGLEMHVAVEMIAGTQGQKFRAVTWGAHETRADGVVLVECYSHTGVCFAAIREARDLAPSTAANRAP